MWDRIAWRILSACVSKATERGGGIQVGLRSLNRGGALSLLPYKWRSLKRRRKRKRSLWRVGRASDGVGQNLRPL